MLTDQSPKLSGIMKEMAEHDSLKLGNTMRLPEARIKEAILSPDPNMRVRATSYFARSYSADPAIMPLVIQAVETHGRQDRAHHVIGWSIDLRQTEDTIDWIINELNQEQADQYESYTYNLSMVLVHAEPALLLPREAIVLESRHFLPNLHEHFTERLRMSSWDEATCWRELEDFCEKGKDKDDTRQAKLDHANRIVEALARYGKNNEEKVCALLSQKVDDYSPMKMKWLEPLAVRLAGLARLEAAIPLVLAKLQEDVDGLLNEGCATALTRIGTPAVLEAVAKVFPRAGHAFRLYATGPLATIHADLAVEKGLGLLRQEKELDIQQNLAYALLSQFACEGIDASRQLLLGRELDFEGKGLQDYLVETCTIMGERFPEYDEWLATAQKEKEEHWKEVEELEAEIAERKLEIDRLKAEIARQKAAHARAQATRWLPRSQERRSGVSSSKRAIIGRNDPCPCRSGKKFKHCCLRKQVGI